ncbi:VOC family protein [Sphingomonas jatrophae]|uniref:Glyoxalase/Bleomycin resistance protein/Dioxygenase superfamily protein n=1 Tax=Sphingomonas jatrophae TaxID=1166337 RepID=A0A1I6M1U9_9SPHN|nr:VOC family protein [Sphingomonas jatrophae]SFS09643.1 Glyoxalase/Bleomycin resistance protein/Dioxygenase superfamily protein [Sphingomonas jatrophae]
MTKDRSLFQQAWFVSSIDAAAKRWAEAFGAGPFFMVRHHRTEEFSYRGAATEAAVSYAFGYLGDTMIQFIEQHDDAPSIYRDMYGPGEEGFHHVAYLVSDFAAERERWIALGYPLACELYADGVNAAYFDTRPLNGGFTEIHGDPMHIMGLFGLWHRAHLARDASTPATIEQGAITDYARAPLLPLTDA